jgi:hypothetical protein
MQWRAYAGENAGNGGRMHSATALAGLALRVGRSAERQAKRSLDRSSGSRPPVCALSGRALIGLPRWPEQGEGRRLGSLRISRLCLAFHRGKALQILREVEEGSRKPDFAMHLGTLFPSAEAIAPSGHCASSLRPRASFLSPTVYLMVATRASCCGTLPTLYLRALYFGTIDVPLLGVVQ